MAKKNKARRGGGGGGAAASSSNTRARSRGAQNVLPNGDAPPPSEKILLARLRAGTLVISDAQKIGFLRMYMHDMPAFMISARAAGAVLADDPNIGDRAEVRAPGAGLVVGSLHALRMGGVGAAPLCLYVAACFASPTQTNKQTYTPSPPQ